MSIASLLGHYGLPALFLGAAFEGEAAVITGGLIAHRGLISYPGAMIAACAGSFTADQIFFHIARHFRQGRLVQRAKAKPLFARALALVERYPIGFIFAFRFIYGFRTISPFAIGTTSVSSRLFLIVNAVAALIWGCAFVTLGYLAGHEVEALMARYAPSTTTLLLIAGAVVALVTLVVILRRRWRAKLAA